MAKSPRTPEEKAAYEARKKTSDEERLRSRGRAISTEEKREVIERLFRVWEKFPELRLSQLIVNSMRDDYTKMDAFFYVEDRPLSDAAEEFAKKQGSQ